EVESFSVSQGATTLYETTFDWYDGPQWRQVFMTNAAGVQMRSTLQPPAPMGQTAGGDDLGSWGVSITNPWIHQRSNGFEDATPGAPNTDFMSTAMVIDEPGSAAYSNCELKVRMGSADNDGYGVLLRVQDDNNFYRVNFLNEGP